MATLSPIREPTEFTTEHAKIAASLITQTSTFGLSSGDRACFALGIALKAQVYTADRSWKNLKLGMRTHVVREKLSQNSGLSHAITWGGDFAHSNRSGRAVA